jgi:hypothetical protein
LGLLAIMNMSSLKRALSGLVALATAISADDEMGPAAFMWPEDRVWSGAMDNTAPCGSVATAGNRTEFPLGMFQRLDCPI